MNPLKKAGAGAARGWRTARDGTTRTASWVKGGVTGFFGGLRNRISGAWEAIGGAGLARRARTNPRLAVIYAAGTILALAWIGWTIYVWSDNGSAAGLGVLISWPAVLLGLALIASPFVAAALLVRRLRPDDESSQPIAGGAEPGDSPEQTTG